MRVWISEFFYWLSDLFHEHAWGYYTRDGREVWVDYRSCKHKGCHKFQSRTAGGFE
jgi:hypothetical protein